MSLKEPKILNLNLIRKWFDMTDQEIKKEEYRAITPYWTNRLTIPLTGEFISPDHVRLMNGMSSVSPVCCFEFKGLRVGEGKEEWGAFPGVKYYIISYGKKIY